MSLDQVVELILTPAGRERLAGGWARLPKPVRTGLLTTAVIFALMLVGFAGGWATYQLGEAGYVVLAVVTGCLTTALVFGGMVVAITWGD
jgi:hypothetical protein